MSCCAAQLRVSRCVRLTTAEFSTSSNCNQSRDFDVFSSANESNRATASGSGIARKEPRCFRLPYNGSVARFEHNRARLEGALKMFQTQFIKQHNLDVTPGSLTEREKGFYLTEHPYLLPTYRPELVTAYKSAWHKFRLRRYQAGEKYDQIHASSQTMAPTLAVKIARFMQQHDWEGLRLADIMENPETIDELRARFESLSPIRQQLLNVRLRDVVPLPGIHRTVFPAHKWPRAWLAALSIDRSSPSGNDPVIEMQWRVEFAYKMSSLVDTWPLVADDYGYTLPRFVFGNVALRRPLFPRPDSWTEWKVATVNYIVVP